MSLGLLNRLRSRDRFGLKLGINQDVLEDSEALALINKGVATVTSGTNTTGFTLVINGSVATGDVLVLAVVNRDSTVDPTVTDDDLDGNSWTRLASQNISGDTGALSVWWKRATSGTASKTITVSGCTGSCSGVVMPYRGCSITANPFGTPVGEANASGEESQVGITTTVAGSMVIHVVGANNDQVNLSNRTATDPAALPEDAEGASIGGNDCSVSIASAVRTTAGATGVISWTQSNAPSASIAIELRAPSLELLSISVSPSPMVLYL